MIGYRISIIDFEHNDAPAKLALSSQTKHQNQEALVKLFTDILSNIWTTLVLTTSFVSAQSEYSY